MPMTRSHASKKNPTPGRSSLTPSKLDQSEGSVTHVLANKDTVFDCREECRITILLLSWKFGYLDNINEIYIFGQYIDNIWTIFRQYLNNIWPIFGQYLDNISIILG